MGRARPDKLLGGLRVNNSRQNQEFRIDGKRIGPLSPRKRCPWPRNHDFRWWIEQTRITPRKSWVLRIEGGQGRRASPCGDPIPRDCFSQASAHICWKGLRIFVWQSRDFVQCVPQVQMRLQQKPYRTALQSEGIRNLARASWAIRSVPWDLPI